MDCWRPKGLLQPSGFLRRPTSAAGGADEAETTAWVAAVVINGGSVSGGLKTIVNTMIAGLKADSVWTKLDRLWFHAAEDQPGGLTDMVALELAAAVNSPTFTASQGFTFASTKYLTTTYNPSTAGGNLTQNSAHVLSYCRTIDASANFLFTVGGSDGTNQVVIGNNSASAGAYTSIINAGGNNLDFSSNPQSTGALLLGTRTGANAVANYKNGSADGSSGAVASAGLTNAAFSIGARGGSFQPASQIAITAWGGGLNATEAGNLSTRLNDAMTSLGTNVY